MLQIIRSVYARLTGGASYVRAAYTWVMKKSFHRTRALGIFDLPREVRDKIYHEYFSSEFLAPEPTFSLANVNHQLRDECHDFVFNRAVHKINLRNPSSNDDDSDSDESDVDEPDLGGRMYSVVHKIECEYDEKYWAEIRKLEITVPRICTGAEHARFSVNLNDRDEPVKSGGAGSGCPCQKRYSLKCEDMAESLRKGQEDDGSKGRLRLTTLKLCSICHHAAGEFMFQRYNDPYDLDDPYQV